VRIATRATKSGHYVLAEDMYNQALERSGWWYRYNKRDELEDVDEEEAESSGSEVEEDEKKEEGGEGDSDEDSDTEVEEVEVHHEAEVHTHDLKESAVRILCVRERAPPRHERSECEGGVFLWRTWANGGARAKRVRRRCFVVADAGKRGGTSEASAKEVLSCGGSGLIRSGVEKTRATRVRRRYSPAAEAGGFV
jgi:hypothetical protein